MTTWDHNSFCLPFWMPPNTTSYIHVNSSVTRNTTNSYISFDILNLWGPSNPQPRLRLASRPRKRLQSFTICHKMPLFMALETKVNMRIPRVTRVCCLVPAPDCFALARLMAVAVTASQGWPSGSRQLYSAWWAPWVCYSCPSMTPAQLKPTNLYHDVTQPHTLLWSARRNRWLHWVFSDQTLRVSSLFLNPPMHW